MRLVADNFGLKIGIEGEKEFKKALSEVRKEIYMKEVSVLRSSFNGRELFHKE